MTAKRIKATIRWITDSWMVILFFVFFFLFWEWSVDWFSIPRYILPKPSTIVVNASADLPRLIDYTYITGLETILGYLTAIVIAIPLGLAITFMVRFWSSSEGHYCFSGLFFPHCPECNFGFWVT